MITLCAHVPNWASYIQCQDIDECEEAARDGVTLCAENSACRNTLGSYNCTCFSGYARISGTCIHLPAEVLENGIRLTVMNYNKQNAS